MIKHKKKRKHKTEDYLLIMLPKSKQTEEFCINYLRRIANDSIGKTMAGYTTSDQINAAYSRFSEKMKKNKNVIMELLHSRGHLSVIAPAHKAALLELISLDELEKFAFTHNKENYEFSIGALKNDNFIAFEAVAHRARLYQFASEDLRKTNKDLAIAAITECPEMYGFTMPPLSEDASLALLCLEKTRNLINVVTIESLSHHFKKFTDPLLCLEFIKRNNSVFSLLAEDIINDLNFYKAAIKCNHSCAIYASEEIKKLYKEDFLAQNPIIENITFSSSFEESSLIIKFANNYEINYTINLINNYCCNNCNRYNEKYYVINNEFLIDAPEKCDRIKKIVADKIIKDLILLPNKNEIKLMFDDYICTINGVTDCNADHILEWGEKSLNKS